MPETSNASFEEMKLQVGARLQLLLHRSSKTIYYSTLIGYTAGEYLLVKVPMERGLSVPMRDSEAVTLRVFSGVAVYTFDCYIESVQLSPHYYMHLSFPKKISATPLRDAPRVKVSLPVQVRHPRDTGTKEALLSDLSITGAYITAGSTIGDPGDTISVTFSFHLRPTNHPVTLNVNASVRSSQEINGGAQMAYGAGIHFENIAPTDQVMLQHFLYEADDPLTRPMSAGTSILPAN